MSYQWGDIDQAGTQEQFFVDYLDGASALQQTQDYKHQTYLMLKLKPGNHVLDVGCGAGDDLLSLAHMVGPTGSVCGVDNSQIMYETASRRTAHLDWVKVEKSHGGTLPFPDNSFDACRSDRVFIHLDEPDQVVDEMLRVLKPGGRILIADPEYDTLTLNVEPYDVSRAVVRHLSDVNRNSFAGRRIFGHFRQRNLADIVVWPNTAVFHDPEAAERVLGFKQAAQDMARAGDLLESDVNNWLEGLQKHRQTGSFLCTMTGLSTVAQKPGD